MKGMGLWRVGLVLVLLFSFGVVKRSAKAASVIVDSTTDVSDGDTSSITALIDARGADNVISLREAIEAANNTAEPNTINFAIPGFGVQTIQPDSPLPALTGGSITINGYSQPSAGEATNDLPARLLVEIDGTHAGALSNGLVITSTGNVVKGLVINRFAVNGIAIGKTGESEAADNHITGNHIGTNANGTVDLGNTLDGVFIGLGAQHNTVGGDTPAERNVISGNDLDGVGIHGSITMSNTVTGNYIGLAANGIDDLGNNFHGVYIYGNTKSNTIGGDSIGERNLISENGRNGVYLAGAETSGNTVSGNFIGTDESGLLDKGNFWEGVVLTDGAHDNTIGPDNIISGNDLDGVYIFGSGTMNNTVTGNYIGTDYGGLYQVSNTHEGVFIFGGARDNTIGPDNVISGNGERGIRVEDGGTTGNTITGNLIGLKMNGSEALGNGNNGITISAGAQNNTIGPDNVISGNVGEGVRLDTNETSGNSIVGNNIGTSENGMAAVGNVGRGVFIFHALNNSIGGTSPGDRNVISGNNSSGVTIMGMGSMGYTIAGNYIGLAADGDTDLGNGRDGVNIHGDVQDNTVGPGNVISGNDWCGVSFTAATLSVAYNPDYHISATSAPGNSVKGNYIGTDASGTKSRGNARSGVCLETLTHDNSIGGDSASDRNVISGNDRSGVYISGDEADNNIISGNYIGTAANGTDPLGNTEYGVYIGNGAQNNTIGGDTPAEGNVISDNSYGIFIDSEDTTNNTVSNNFIGTTANGSGALGNENEGVHISFGAQDNTIGPANTIAHNSGDGVRVDTPQAFGNIITQNRIHSNDKGIDLTNGANHEIAAPAISTTTLGPVEITGTACAGCSVEVFANVDNDGEGETYIGGTIATPGGDFTLTVDYLSQPYLTATATYAADGTSEFSEVFTADIPILSTSTKVVDRAMAAPAEALTYTITLTNTGTAAGTAALTDTLPANVTWVNQFSTSAGTITWDDENERLLWNGSVSLGTPVFIVFQVTVGSNVSNGTLISNTSDARDEAGNNYELGPATTTVVIFKLNLPMVLSSSP